MITMLKTLTLLATLATACLGHMAPLGKRHPGIDYVADEYMVQLKSQKDLSAHLSAISSLLALADPEENQIYRSYDINDGDFVAYAAKIKNEQILEKILNMEEVVRIEPNQILSIHASQYSPPNWGLDRLDQRNLPLNSLYIYSDVAGEGVDAYIIDTGINIEHIEFSSGNAVWGVTTPRNSEDKDLNGHGTHVASTVCGSKVGVAKKAKCIAVKVMKDSGLGTVFDITDGVSWVADQHRASNGTAKSVANMSLGSPISNPIIDASVAALVRSGVVVVVAAGNSDRNACNGSPAGQVDMITVGASDSNDVKPDFSNWGPCVDLFAPGVNITAAWWSGNEEYFVASGTSMASPHVCGLAALILAEKPIGFDQEQMRAELVKLATPDVLSSIGEGSPNLLAFNNPPPAL